MTATERLSIRSNAKTGSGDSRVARGFQPIVFGRKRGRLIVPASLIEVEGS